MDLKRTQNTVSIFDKLATQYQDKYMDVGLYHDSFNSFCDSIPKQNATILELASGREILQNTC